VERTSNGVGLEQEGVERRQSVWMYGVGATLAKRRSGFATLWQGSRHVKELSLLVVVELRF
jgi:hypothetical protein